MSQKAVVFTGSSIDGELVEFKDVPIPTVSDDEILVKAHAWASNPTDWKHIVVGWSEKGNIPGSDLSGVVAKVGANVVGFKEGDFVSTFQRGGSTKRPDTGLFKEYAIVNPITTFKYPTLTSSTVESGHIAEGKVTTFEDAASINLSIFTVGLSAFFLGFNDDVEVQKGKSVLIWGGATATGMIAIQVFKKLYGLNVITVSSPKNHEFLKSLGADAVFDYHDADVIEQIKKYGGESIVYGFDTISSPETFNTTYQALADKAPVVFDNLLMLNESVLTGEKKSNVTLTVGTLAYYIEGIEHDFSGLVVPPNPAVVANQKKFLAKANKAILDGTIKHAPLRKLAGGLSAVEESFSLLRNDKVSGEKLVFSA